MVQVPIVACYDNYLNDHRVEKVIEGRPQPRSSKPPVKAGGFDPTDREPSRERNSGNGPLFHSDKAEV